MKRIIVLKSLRTRSGAEDWARTMHRQFPNAQVMDTDTLKGFHDVAYTVDPTGFASHVVVEEDLSPVIEVLKEGEFGEVVRALIDKGYVSIDAYGLCFTDKWHELSNKFMADVVDRGLDTFKSANADFDAGDAFRSFMTGVGSVLKSAGEIPSVPENNETGEEPEEPEAISDEKVAAATKAKKAPESEDVADQLDTEAVTDAQVDALTVQKSSTEAPVEEEEEEEENPEGTVFKSLTAARTWERTGNPDVSMYYVDSMTFEEKKAHGIRNNYIVRRKLQRDPIGAFGNKIIRK